MNGQLGDTKTKVMAGIEVAAIGALAVIGGVTSGGIIWTALGPLLANHAWSASDAYMNARRKTDPAVQSELFDAQRTLELSRQRRFEREQYDRSTLRDRVMQAGEQAY
jgi:hypothetical protein